MKDTQTNLRLTAVLAGAVALGSFLQTGFMPWVALIVAWELVRTARPAIMFSLRK